jgi:hypothetical protein
MLNNQNLYLEYFSIGNNVDNQHLIVSKLIHLMLIQGDEYLILLVRINTFLILIFGICVNRSFCRFVDQLERMTIFFFRLLYTTWHLDYFSFSFFLHRSNFI